MVLSDRELIPMFSTLVGHNNTELLNPASIDIRIGLEAMIEIPGFKHRSKIALRDDRVYMLPPGGSCLVSTLEKITIPNGYVGCIFLKSSRAREGYNHALAGWVDPGWSGVITLEIMNTLQYGSLPIYPGFKIAQLTVSKCSSESLEPYEGNYKNAEGVQASYYI